MDDRENLAPNFLLIGAGKSATTSLASQLAQHPDVFVTRPKEPHYFSLEYGRGLPWYLDLFREAGGRRMRGEASITYSQATLWPGVAERISSTLGPDCRLIYIMRRPVEALASHVFHDLSRGHLPAGAKLQDHIYPGSPYVDARRYEMQIREYLAFFDRKNFLFLTYEDYIEDPQGVLSTIFRFLGVDDAFAAADMEPRNVSAGQRRKPAWFRALRSLRRRYEWLRLPGFLRDVAGGLSASGSQAVEAPTLSADDERRIWALVGDDVERLSTLVGRDMTRFWNVPSGRPD